MPYPCDDPNCTCCGQRESREQMLQKELESALLQKRKLAAQAYSLEQERDRLLLGHQALTDRNNELILDNARLLKALRKYGHHFRHCPGDKPIDINSTSADNFNPCKCGLDKALEVPDAAE